jgi:hypothetical protein
MKIESTYIYIGIILLMIIAIYAYSMKKNDHSSWLIGTIGTTKSRDDDLIEVIDNKGDKRQYKNYVEMIDSIYDPKGPNLLKENQSQYDFKKLLMNLDSINDRELVKLKGMTNHQSYIKTTTRDRLKLDLDQITEKIIPLINSGSYDFVKNGYGDVDVWTDKHNNEEIKYELFVWDKIHYFETKFLIHVIKFVDPKYAGSYGVKNSPYLFPTYQIGIPSEDQLIPDPMSVITTGNMADSMNGICTKDPLPIQHLYINRVLIQNSTLVVNYYKNMYPYPILQTTEDGRVLGGITDMKLDFMRVKGDNNPIFQTGREYNKTIRLDEEPEWQSSYPCKAPPLDWNAEGVMYYPEGTGVYPEGKCPALCAGTRSSSMLIPTEPNFWINNFQSQPCGLIFESLFNRVGPNGTFFGGGKK